MKKTSLIFVALIGLAFNQAMAQIEAGRLFVGGGFGLSTSSSKDIAGGTTTNGPKTTQFNLLPQAGYLLSENFAVGVGIGLVTGSTSFTNFADEEVKNSFNIFTFSPFARYYANIAEKFYGFGEASIGLGSGSSKTSVGGTTDTTGKFSTFGLGVAAGFNYFPADNYGFEFKLSILGLNSFTDKDPANTANKSVDTDFNFSLNTFSPSLGFFYFF